MIKYIGRGGEIVLDRLPYVLRFHDFLGYEWFYTETPQLDLRGSVARSFRRSSRLYMASLTVAEQPGSAPLHELINRFASITEPDILAEQPGKLYVGDDYLLCYITVNSKADFNRTGKHVQVELTILAPHPVWFRTAEFSYFPGGGTQTTAGKKYPLQYPYKYAFDGTDQMYDNDHYAPALARIIIYGHAENPQFSIDGHVYLVNDTVQSGERIEIDQLARTVVKVYANGSRENIFGKRGKQYSVFEPLPPGKHMLVSSGAFGIDIKLFQERSEPEWKSSMLMPTW